MNLSRVQIEGGFLNGFDLQLASGLNVIIGARGTGKTSLIELIRYALDAKNHTTESRKKSIEHALAILDDGQITVTLNEGEEAITVIRIAGQEPISTFPFITPIVLSQTEIETLGLSESGRLGLLDSFIKDKSLLSTREAAAINGIKSIYKEIESLEAEISNLELPSVNEEYLKTELLQLEKKQEEHRSKSSVSESMQIQLNLLTNAITEKTLQVESINNFVYESGIRKQDLANTIFDDGLNNWTESTLPDPILGLREEYESLLKEVGSISNKFTTLIDQANGRLEKLKNEIVVLERDSRNIRAELDEAISGAGAIAKSISNIKTHQAQIANRKAVIADRTNKLNALRETRDSRYNELAEINHTRYELRVKKAQEINQILAPTISVEVQAAAQYNVYSSLISDALRGSGLKYNELVPVIAETISPKELVELVESQNFEGLSDLIFIPKDRASRVLTQLKDFGLSEIITCRIEDSVQFKLLDGLEYKDIATLSAGQRCTVILSIVLQHTDRILIIDQPEDHLDNAFITKTVIKALRERKGLGQIILSTHNANIPVLGDADLVIELTSDGRNGFIQVCKPLNHTEAVTAITNVMEGGRDAFKKRSAFYEANEL